MFMSEYSPYFHPYFLSPSHSPCSEKTPLVPGPTPHTALWTASSFLSRRGTSALRLCLWKCSRGLTCHASTGRPGSTRGEKCSRGGHLIKANTYSQPPSSISNVAMCCILRKSKVVSEITPRHPQKGSRDFLKVIVY